MAWLNAEQQAQAGIGQSGVNKQTGKPDGFGQFSQDFDPFLALLQQVTGRTGTGFGLQRKGELASLGLGMAGQAYRDLPGLVRENFAQPRQDILDSFGGQFQNTADRQGQLGAQINQQFGQSGLGSLRGTQTAALEQQAQRQNLGTRDAMSGRLGQLGTAQAGMLGQAQSALPNFLMQQLGINLDLMNDKILHGVSRKQQKADKNNALGGALGSLLGAGVSQFGAGGAFGSGGYFGQQGA
jgi:hypothetical protein